MPLHARQLVTIIAEAEIEQALIRDVQRLGAHGYTISDARGGGDFEVKRGGFDHDSNIRMEVVCDLPTAEAIAEHVGKTYCPHYGVIVYISEVRVLRPGKFT